MASIIKRSDFEKEKLFLFRLQLKFEYFSQGQVILKVLKSHNLDFFLKGEAFCCIEEQNEDESKTFSMISAYGSIWCFFFWHHFVKNPFF